MSESEPLASAHEVWERTWTSDAGRARWLAPEPMVEGLVPMLRARGFARVLDVGCGVGRHAQYLAGLGFACAGVDASASGLAFARSAAESAGYKIDYREAAFYALPFEDHSFDALIAWNVIYHGDRDIARQAADEFARVLVPGGLYVGTMLSKRNSAYGHGREVRLDAFVVDDATDDKVHPHLYVDAASVLALHSSFEVLELHDREQAPGAFHWEFTFERRRA